MATFIPPTDNFVYWADENETGILAHLRPGKRGRNVFKMTDGSFQETEPSDHTTIAYTYHGGHVDTVEGQEQADLVAAGYGAFIS